MEPLTTKIELLTIKAAAAYLGLSRTSIYALIDRGDIKPIRLIKDAPRILRGDLDALVRKARADADIPDSP